MKARIVIAVAAVLLSVSASHAQSSAEQLQKAIYTQDTVGDLDGAIRLYQQIVATAPVGDVRNQAQRRLQVAQEMRRRVLAGAGAVAIAKPPRGAPLGAALGELSGRTYRHIATGLSMELPAGWRLEGTSPSSDNGEMASFESVDPVTVVNVWMISEPNDWDGINRRLDASPGLKAKSRIENWRLLDYRLREGSTQRTTIGGKQAMVAIGDFTRDTQPMAELLVWIFTERSHVFFFAPVAAGDLHRLKPQFDALVESAIIP